MNVIEEYERMFVYQAWPELPPKVRQSILRKAKRYSASTFPEANPPASGETNSTAENQNQKEQKQ
jgi:hypothetical protein